MATKTIIGREREQKLIMQRYNSDKAELVAVYGRRRIGKTFLVKQVFDDRFDFSFSGMYKAPRAVQLSMFKAELARKWGRADLQISSWMDAFACLRDYLEALNKEKVVVFLDELPWMDTPKSNFLVAFSYFWNTWGSTFAPLKLFVCGSATTWMLNKIIGDKGGLYGRCTLSIALAPFCLGEVEAFLREVKGVEWSRYQVLEAYMIMGGVPYYLDMLDRSLPFAANVDALFFQAGAPLRGEYDFLYRSLFEDAALYRRIVETLATKLKGMTRGELQEALRIKSGGSLTTALADLCKCDFLRSYSSIGKSSKDVVYQLTDLFSLFHLRFVSGTSGQDERFWQNVHGQGVQTSWAGYAFEQVCLHHIRQIKERLGIAGVLSNVYAWACRPFDDADGTHWEGGQVDMLIDRGDEVVSLCEMKYKKDAFVIDAAYERRLRQRASTFARVTKTRKALQHVFVTTYGVAPNAHSGIVSSQVTMDDLFRM